jgi:cyd operon protein YbgT
MLCFAWILGLGLAAAAGVLNALWNNLRGARSLPNELSI